MRPLTKGRAIEFQTALKETRRNKGETQEQKLYRVMDTVKKKWDLEDMNK